LLVNANCDLCVCDFGLARGVDANLEEALTGERKDILEGCFFA